MKKSIPLEQRTITVPHEMMVFAEDRVTKMLNVNVYQSIRRLCAEAYLLACNDMVQIKNRI
jgi:hypothetical protein